MFGAPQPHVPARAPVAMPQDGLQRSREGGTPPTRQFVGLRRINFLLHWLYYAARHGTTKHATWACHHKGIVW